jgi:DNA polymerase-3 subunit gamma/tau
MARVVREGERRAFLVGEPGTMTGSAWPTAQAATTSREASGSRPNWASRRSTRGWQEPHRAPAPQRSAPEPPPIAPEDDTAEDDDPDLDESALSGHELIVRELGATVVEEVSHE